MSSGLSGWLQVKFVMPRIFLLSAANWKSSRTRDLCLYRRPFYGHVATCDGKLFVFVLSPRWTMFIQASWPDIDCQDITPSFLGGGPDMRLMNVASSFYAKISFTDHSSGHSEHMAPTIRDILRILCVEFSWNRIIIHPRHPRNYIEKNAIYQSCLYVRVFFFFFWNSALYRSSPWSSWD